MLTGASVSNLEARLAQFVKNDFENLIQPIVQKTITESLSALKITSQPRQELHSHAHVPEQKNGAQNLSRPPAAIKESRQRVMGVRRRISIFWKRLSTSFGFVSLHYDMIHKSHTANELCNKESSFEFRCTIIPRCFLRKATIITGTWEPIPKVSLTGLNFQFYPIVDSNSAIFRACASGDIATMKELFGSRQASPHDIDNNGRDLLLVSKEYSWTNSL